MKHQSGFTLIELIMVIVILGILAATAMPKFADLKYDARLAALEGLKGSMDAAGAIAHGVQQAKGLGSMVDVTLAGVGVSMVYGYPTSATTGIFQAMDISLGKYALSTVGIGLSGVNGCYVQYLPATVGGMSAQTSLVVTGC